MNEKRIISVIIPVHNVQHCLNRCIESLLAQTLSAIEYIFIDDGSTDESADILWKYQKSDSRIKIISQANAGASAARNAGLDVCSGEYILFCDSDDTVSPVWAEKLYQAILKFPSAWIVCGINSCNEQGDVQYTNVLSCGELFADEYYKVFSAGLSGSLSNKIFRNDIIQQHMIRFDLNKRRGEDVEFNLKYFAYTQGIFAIDEPLYNYFRYDSYNTLTNVAYDDEFEFQVSLYRMRVGVISDADRRKYDYFVWHALWNCLHVYMENANGIFAHKIQACQKKITMLEFQSLLERFGEEMGKISYAAIQHSFLLYWIVQSAHKIRRGLRIKR